MANLRILCLSDTHGRHREVQIDDPEAYDMLLFSGDICMSIGLTTDNVLEANAEQVMDFASWLYELPIPNKVVVGGNHDFFLQYVPDLTRQIFEEAGVVYLCDESALVCGKVIWGSPRTPEFGNMAFTYPQGSKSWTNIPSDTDILITHGPPKGTLDKVRRKGGGVVHTGCEKLAKMVKAVAPELHLFGHIHVGRGQISDGHTQFVNAALVDNQYRIQHRPMTVELPE